MHPTTLSICGVPVRRRGSGRNAEVTVINEGHWRWVACGNLDDMATRDGTKMASTSVSDKDGLLLVP